MQRQMEGEIADVSLSFYPNPVKDDIKIEYEIRKPGTVNIQIVDITGRQVETFSRTHTDSRKISVTRSAAEISHRTSLCASTIE